VLLLLRNQEILEIQGALVYVVGFVGTILLCYSVFLEEERRQDLVCVIGAVAMIPYCIWIGNFLFLITMAGIAITSLIEFLEIITGRHPNIGAPTELVKNPKGKLYQMNSK
jgi:hypothetical protein